MGNELVIPDTFKTAKPAGAFAVLNPAEESLSEGIGQSYGVIGYRGKVWSLRYHGERHNILRPDDGTPSAYLDVIILGQGRGKSKSYYEKADTNSFEEGKRPVCASIDGVRPDNDATQKQAEACAVCPRNVWKTDPKTGRKGRECSDYKRLAVLILPTQTKPVLGEPLMEPVFLRVPAASLNSLGLLGDTMAKQGWHFSSYITRISFDPNVAHPQMVFKPLQGLTDKEGPLILSLRNDATVGRITGGDVTAAVTDRTVEVLPPGTHDTGLGVSVDPRPSAAVVQLVPQSSNFGNNGAAPPVTNESNGLGLSGQGTPEIGGGSSGLVRSVSDTGEPQESDADLDARIAALIKP